MAESEYCRYLEIHISEMILDHMTVSLHLINEALGLG